MTTDLIETPVLIVGGGPTGSALAIELGWRGVAATVLEQGDGTVDHPRLGIILTRTMEFCRRWGIADRIYNCGFNNDYHLNVVYCTSMTGYSVGRDANASCNELMPPEQSPEKRQRCPQIWFNPILENAAAEYSSNKIRHLTRLSSFEDRGEYVEATAINSATGEITSYRAKYLVACDGAASTVRSELGIGMEGNPLLSYSLNIFIRCPELLRMHDKGEAERYIFVGQKGTWANLTVVDGRELWRITIIGDEKMMNLTTMDAHVLVQSCFGTDKIPFEIISVKPWRRSELTATKFMQGRIFLAGDAAHTMSPTGGHGMSTGVADAVDLGWKISATLAGWGGAALLESYEIERRPVAAMVAAASAQNFRAWTSASDCEQILENSAAGDECRLRIGDHMLRVGREDWDSLGLQLGYIYDPSPICVPDGTPRPAVTALDYRQVARPGSRAPHAWLRPGLSTLDLFGRSFVLLKFAQDVDVAAIQCAARRGGIPLQVVTINDYAIRELYQGDLTLVRPDGFVAWRGNRLPIECDSLMAAVSGTLETCPVEYPGGHMTLVVDSHAHILDKQFLDELQLHKGLTTVPGMSGQTLLRTANSTVAWHRPEFFDLDDRIRVMDSLDVDVRILSLSSPSIYDWPAADQVRLARHVNQVTNLACERHPQRFRGVATLPLGDTRAALDELDRVMDEPYMVGVAIGSNIGGKPLDHPDLEPIWNVINQRRVPVVEHPMLPLGSDHLDAYELPLRVGFVYDTTTAVTRMIYGGVFERYPDFPFVLAHTGGALLSLLERLDNGFRIFPDCRKHIDKLPSEYAKRLYYDTCSFYAPVLKMALEIVGSKRLLWGSDDPFIGSGPDYVLAMQLSDADTSSILGENAREIFKLQLD